MEKQYLVLKFGGTSVAEPSAWQMIAARLQQHIQQGVTPLVVCSALSGVSDKLAQLMPEQALSGQYQVTVDEVKARHREFANALGLDAEKHLAEEFALLEKMPLGVHLTQTASPLLEAKTMALGELMLTKLACAYLASQGIDIAWLDAREYLQSIDNPHFSESRKILSAYCDHHPDPAMQQQFNKLPNAALITQGFIARNAQGQTVLLGRGGSDTSAAYFASKLSAKECQIWTDVPGIYTTNPHLVPAARLITHLTFAEAREIAATGAKVLHPQCLDPLAHNNIPLSIHCTHHPEWQGTLINNEIPLVEAQVKAVSMKTGVVIVSMETTMMWQQVGFLSNVFGCFAKHGVSVDLLATSENNVTVSLDSSRYHYSAKQLEALLKELNDYCDAKIQSPCAAISLVGRDIRSILHQLTSVFAVFKEQKIYLLSQATNDLNLTFVIDETEANVLLHKIHELLFEHPAVPEVFGKSWQNAFPTHVPTDYWWYQKREQLLEKATNTPIYIYNLEIVSERTKALTALSNINALFYAIKANWQPDVLKTIYQAGLGFECVSAGELNYIFDLFPDIDPNRVLFTPNFADKTEYQLALEKGVYVNLDNVHPLTHWPELFADKDILLRVDPGLGRGHHKYVQTGGSHSKFGISPSQLSSLQPLLKQHNIKVIGLHVHFGSGVLASKSWSETAIFLAKIAEDFPEVKILDLGGGLGVPEKFGQASLNLELLNESLNTIRAAYPQYQLWLEPGRYLVAESGVLLARVTQLKEKGDVHYIGIDAGMNSLIRPSLYSAYHEIVNLSKINQPRVDVAHIVGPICETGDTLGYSRVMPTTEEGDIILIANAGAYGRVMSSKYNMREPAREEAI